MWTTASARGNSPNSQLFVKCAWRRRVSRSRRRRTSPHDTAILTIGSYDAQLVLGGASTSATIGAIDSANNYELLVTRNGGSFSLWNNGGSTAGKLRGSFNSTAPAASPAQLI